MLGPVLICLQQSSCMTAVKMSIKNWNNLKNMEGWFYLCDCALKEFFADSLENICEAKCRLFFYWTHTCTRNYRN